jgi:hypothetical protein
MIREGFPNMNNFAPGICNMYNVYAASGVDGVVLLQTGQWTAQEFLCMRTV